MAANATVEVGFVAGAVRAGLAQLRGNLRSFREDANKEFSVGNFIAAGAIIGAIRGIMDEAGNLADLSARFGVAAEGIQRIGNAAKEDGGSLEAVAAAMNKGILAQAKARDGNKEVLKSLNDLKISASEFIALSPEEAFYKIADAVHDSDDATTSYAAVVQLLGKSAGALIPTLQRGSEEIREIGDSAGVMSNETVALLDDAGDRMGRMFNKLKVLGSEAFVWVARAAETLGATMADVVARVQYTLGMIDKGTRDAIVAEAQKQYGDIWKDKPADDPSKKRGTSIADTEEDIKSAEELQKLYDKLDEQKRQGMVDQLEGEAKINELISERDALYAKASSTDDLKEQAELWIKAGEIEKNINSEREKAAKDYDSQQDKIAKKKETLAKKQLDNERSGMTQAEKLASLEEERAKINEKMGQTDGEEDKLDLAIAREDVDKQISEIKNKKPEFEVKASNLTKIGGGGIATLTTKGDAAERAAKAAEKNVKKGEEQLSELKRIKDAIDNRWNP